MAENNPLFFQVPLTIVPFIRGHTGTWSSSQNWIQGVNKSYWSSMCPQITFTVLNLTLCVAVLLSQRSPKVHGWLSCQERRTSHYRLRVLHRRSAPSTWPLSLNFVGNIRLFLWGRIQGKAELYSVETLVFLAPSIMVSVCFCLILDESHLCTRPPRRMLFRSTVSPLSTWRNRDPAFPITREGRARNEITLVPRSNLPPPGLTTSGREHVQFQPFLHSLSL